MGLGRRERRGIVVIALAVFGLIATAIFYVTPSLGGAAQRDAAKPSPPRMVLPLSFGVDYDFATPSLGWALITDIQIPRYWVFKTSDAARRWALELTEDAVIEHPDLKFFDGMHGYFSLGYDRVYGTADGGRDWTPIHVPDYTLEQLTFSDPRHGWYLGSSRVGDELTYHLERTTDGGRTWSRLPAPPAIGPFEFRDAAEGWVAGDPARPPAVYSTFDGGTTWQAHALPVGSADFGATAKAATAVHLLSGSGVVAVVGFGALTSFDAGITWTSVGPPVQSFTDLAFQDATHWWAMRAADLYKSSDTGRSWHVVVRRSEPWKYQVQVLDAGHAWALLLDPPRQPGGIGMSGLAYTNDGGLSWTHVNPPQPA